MALRFLPSLVLVVFLFAGNLFAHEAPKPMAHKPYLEPGDDITIGMVNVQSGPAAALGKELLEGTRVYIDKVNSNGGVKGHRLVLKTYDDGYEPERTLDAMNTLITQNDVLAFFGFVGTPPSRVAMAVATSLKIPYITPFTGAAFLRDGAPRYVVNLRASYRDEAEHMVAYLTGQRGIKRIGLFIQDDAYGSAGRVGVQKALTKRKMEVVAVGKYKRNSLDIQAALTKLKTAKPEAVIMVGAYAPSAEFIRQARRGGFDPLFVNMSFVGTQGLLDALKQDGEGVYISQVLPDPMTADLPIIQEYREDMSKAVSGTLTYGTLEGYVNARLLLLGLESIDGPISRESLIDSIRAMQNVDMGGLKLGFSATNNQGLQQTYLTMIKDGKVVPVEGAEAKLSPLP